MSGQNSTDPMDATNPDNGGAGATDPKGKGRAPAAQEPVEDNSMAEDDDDDDDEEDPEEVSRAAGIVATCKFRWSLTMFTQEPEPGMPNRSPIVLTCHD
jgi:hypothetical protein